MTTKAGKRLLSNFVWLADERSSQWDSLIDAIADIEAEARAEGPECCDWRHVWPCPNIPRCDEPGCKAEADCGWPSSTGYRRTCGVHIRLWEEGR